MGQILLFITAILIIMVGIGNLYIITIVDIPASFYLHGGLTLLCFGVGLFLLIVSIRDTVRRIK